MKSHVPLSLTQCRIREGQYASGDSYGMMGAFRLISPKGELLLALSSGTEGNGNKTGWEHVSVSARGRAPIWEEMVFVKNMFWEDHEMAVQYHPPKSEYVNFHPFTLHIWRAVEMSIPMPPSMLVGPMRRP